MTTDAETRERIERIARGSFPNDARGYGLCLQALHELVNIFNDSVGIIPTAKESKRVHRVDPLLGVEYIKAIEPGETGEGNCECIHCDGSRLLRSIAQMEGGEGE